VALIDKGVPTANTPSDMSTSYLIALLFGCVIPTTVFAQRPQTDPRPPTDSIAISMLMSGVYRELGRDLAHAAVDTSANPWRIRLPTDDMPWKQFREHLLAALKVREPTERDSTVRVLTVEPIEVRTDTLVGSFYLGYRWRCGSEWKGNGTGYEVLAIRRGTDWEVRHPAPVLFSDSAPCSP
jgi:hypothetical protein